MEDLKKFIVDLIHEEFGPSPTPIAAKWEQGTLILKPSGDQQAKEIPLEVFFKKIVTIRDNLRVLEQKINHTESIPMADRLSLQAYITKCYGTLTTLNILFKNEKDKFVGFSQNKPEGSASHGLPENLTMGQARKRLGLREHGE